MFFSIYRAVFAIFSIFIGVSTLVQAQEVGQIGFATTNEPKPDPASPSKVRGGGESSNGPTLTADISSEVLHRQAAAEDLGANPRPLGRQNEGLALIDKPIAPAIPDKPEDKTLRFPRVLDSTDDPNSVVDPSGTAIRSNKFHWKDAMYQSLVIQGFQLSYALVFQEKTRRALKGPFLKDYWESIKGVRGWSDGNRFFTNYIAHPMQGAMTGFIYLQNHDRVKMQVFAESKQYWKDRAKALAWSTAWSTNWEIGPISQASIGNVGLNGHGGWVDFVVTPTAGTAWMVTEEALDRYFIRHLEAKNLGLRIALRTFLNPMRSVANVLRLKRPWHRDNRGR